MTRNTFGLRLVWMAVLAVASAAVPAHAQQPDAGPYGDLFGSSRKPQAQSLDIRGSVFGGYDDNLLAQSPIGGGSSLFDPRLQVPGVTTGLTSTAIYNYTHSSRGKSGTSFFVGGVASVQEFTGPDSRPFWTQNYNANTSATTNLTQRISVSLNGSGSYMPYYQYLPSLGAAAGTPGVTVNPAAPSDGATGDNAAPTAPPSIGSPTGTDLNFATEAAFVESWSAGATVTDRITKRSTISANVQWDQTQVFDTKTQSRSARARITHTLTRTLGVHAGYGLQGVSFSQDLSPGNRTLNQLLDVGLDFGDGVTIARHYRLTFSTGTSFLKQEVNTQFVFTGNVSLARTIGRTWSTYISAVRGSSYIVGFANPFITDTVSAGLSGQFARRLGFSAGLNYLHGQDAFSASAGSLVTDSASARLTYAVAEHVGLYTQAAYYQYDVPESFLSTIPFPSHLHRRSLSVGLSFWVPMINRRAERQP